MKKSKHPIREAERYLQDAREILSKKAGKEGNYYSNKKYVKKAGNMAWCGVLTALDGVLRIKKNLPFLKDYQEAVNNIDENMDRQFLCLYDILCLALGCDGNLNSEIVQVGMDEAQSFIDWAEKHYQN